MNRSDYCPRCVRVEDLSTQQLMDLWRLPASERTPFVESTRLAEQINLRTNQGN